MLLQIRIFKEYMVWYPLIVLFDPNIMTKKFRAMKSNNFHLKRFQHMNIRRGCELCP